MRGTEEVLADPAAVASRAAELLLETIATAPVDAPIRICLSGGSTPKRLYELLATPAWRDTLPWSRLHWYWGDERYVPSDHPDSNYRMVREALLDHAPIPAANVNPVPFPPGDPLDAARSYEALLRQHYGSDQLRAEYPLFDFTLLGIGDDGHTASLFPGVAALEETLHWTAAVIGAKPEPRISLTFPALNASRLVLILAAGEGKKEILRRVAAGEKLPVTHIDPKPGRLCWLMDKAAGAGVAG